MGKRSLRYGPTFITQGSIIDGEVDHSVIFTGAEVREGAKVKDCVLMNDVVIGKNAKLNRCLVMDGVKVPDGMTLGKKDSEEVLLVTKAVVDKEVK